ncbi:MAG: DUF4337 family protein [Acetobacteraceae bacterium]
MTQAMERAHETIHEAGHAHGGGHGRPDTWNRKVAVLVSMLATALALVQIGEKQSQNEYIVSHVSVVNDWAFYQAKNVRSVMRASEAAVLESLPGATEPAIQARIRDARDYAARMRDDPKGGDGMQQIAETAKKREAQRADAFHRYHFFEYASGVIEIAIVLASVSIVTAVRALAYGAGALGVGAGLFAIGVGLHLF